MIFLTHPALPDLLVVIMHQPIRVFAALGLFGCVTLTLMSAGCASSTENVPFRPATGSTNGQTPDARGLMGTTTVFGLGAEVTLEELLVGVAGTTVVFTVAIVVAASGVKDIVEAIDEDQENRRRCNEKRNECLDTYRSGRGGPTWNHSRCQACYGACIGLKGEWPSHVYLDRKFVSCK
jgi:hypothetical protein